MTASAQRKIDGESALVRAVARFPAAALPLFKLYMIGRFLVRRRNSVQLYFGARIGIDLWQMMLQRMFYFRFWEPDISSLVEDTLAEGDLFVDLGAHVGYYSLLASHLVGPGGAVVAVEASPATFAMLGENLSRNGAANVRAVNFAVSDQAGELTLYRGAFRNTGASTTDARYGRPAVGRVPARALDEILTAEERARVAMIKIDVEGAELQVLSRLLATLDQYPPHLRIICEFDRPYVGEALSDVFQAFLTAGFEAWRVPNDYSFEAYLAWRGPAPLTRVDDLPMEGCDILLRRSEPSPEPGPPTGS